MIIMLLLGIAALVVWRHFPARATWRDYTLNNLEWAILEEHLGGSKR